MSVTPGSVTKLNPVIGLSTTLTLTSTDIGDTVKMSKVLPKGVLVSFPNGNIALTDGITALNALKPIVNMQELTDHGAAVEAATIASINATRDAALSTMTDAKNNVVAIAQAAADNVSSGNEAAAAAVEAAASATQSASQAETSATSAVAAESTVTTKAAVASTAADNAEISATSAMESATAAAESAEAAALSETNAATSATAAAESEASVAGAVTALTNMPSPTGHDGEVLSVASGAMAWAKRDRAVPLAEGTISAGACDYATGYIFSATISGATTISLTNVPATGTAMLMLRLTNGGSATVTWPSGIKWPGGTTPTLTASGLDEVVLMRTSAGVWSGAVRKDVK